MVELDKDGPEKERPVVGVKSLPQQSLANLFLHCLGEEMFCLDTTSLVPVSAIPFCELSHLFPRYFLGLLSSLHPCPVLRPSALVTDFLALSVPLILKCCPKMLGHRSRLLNAAVIPIYW